MTNLIDNYNTVQKSHSSTNGKESHLHLMKETATNHLIDLSTWLHPESYGIILCMGCSGDKHLRVGPSGHGHLSTPQIPRVLNAIVIDNSGETLQIVGMWQENKV
jgi:hypothetical protein